MVVEQNESESALRQLETTHVEQLAAIEKNIAEKDEQTKLVLAAEKDLMVSRYTSVLIRRCISLLCVNLEFLVRAKATNLRHGRQRKPGRRRNYRDTQSYKRYSRSN